MPPRRPSEALNHPAARQEADVERGAHSERRGGAEAGGVEHVSGVRSQGEEGRPMSRDAGPGAPDARDPGMSRRGGVER